MSQTDYGTFEAKTPRDRTIMHVLYGLHTISWASMYTLAVVAVIVNYIRRGDEVDPLYVAHHNYMISTFWWTVLWLVLSWPIALVMGLTIILIPLMWLPFTVAGLWYLYRCIRGWMRFNDNRPPQ